MDCESTTRATLTWVSTRVLTATLAIGVTVPSRSIRTGTFFLTAVTTSTGTARGPAGCFCAWATASLGLQTSQGAQLLHFAATTAPKASVAASITSIRLFMPAARGLFHRPGLLWAPRPADNHFSG